MNNKLTVPGWITEKEITTIDNLMESISVELHEKSILDVGAFAGKLFYCLHDKYDDWKYVAVDPWERDNVHFVKDWNEDYYKPGNKLDRTIHELDFANYCPFAERHKNYFEEFNTNEKFDIIVLSLISPFVNWYVVLNKSYNYLKDDGFLVVRNMNITKTKKDGTDYFNHCAYMEDMLESTNFKFDKHMNKGKIQVWKK